MFVPRSTSRHVTRLSPRPARSNRGILWLYGLGLRKRKYAPRLRNTFSPRPTPSLFSETVSSSVPRVDEKGGEN